MADELIKLQVTETTDTCSVCGYTDGFHVSFKKQSGKVHIILICPSCHSRFDPSWEISQSK
jgi:transposase